MYKNKRELNLMSSDMPLLVIECIFFFIHDAQYLYTRLIHLYTNPYVCAILCTKVAAAAIVH